MSKVTLEKLKAEGKLKVLSDKTVLDTSQTYTSKTSSVIEKFHDFDNIELFNKNIFEKYTLTYISELNSSHLYEIMTDKTSSEVQFPKYDVIYLDNIIKILQESKFKRAVAWAKCQVEKYSDTFDDTFGSYISNSQFLLFSELEDAAMKIEIDDASIDITMSSCDLSKISAFLHKFEKLEVKKTHNQIGIIRDNGNGLSIKKIKIDSVTLDVSDNYGQSFIPVHDTIVTKLREKKTGLFLLHSSPGNGKSYYIKYLSQLLTERLFIFVPTSMIDSIVSPSLISVLLNNPNAVLILEDAEQAIISREENPNAASLVSNILNISDGIMGSILNVSLILTFNTERANIDKALLRKGRLQAEWEFKELSLIESKKLAKKLGKDENKIIGPTKLCDIYNLDENNFHQEKQANKIGF